MPDHNALALADYDADDDGDYEPSDERSSDVLEYNSAASVSSDSQASIVLR